MNLNETPAERKPYGSPELEEHGTVEQLTHKLPPQTGVGPAGLSEEADNLEG